MHKTKSIKELAQQRATNTRAHKMCNELQLLFRGPKIFPYERTVFKWGHTCVTEWVGVRWGLSRSVQVWHESKSWNSACHVWHILWTAPCERTVIDGLVDSCSARARHVMCLYNTSYPTLNLKSRTHLGQRQECRLDDTDWVSISERLQIKRWTTR